MAVVTRRGLGRPSSRAEEVRLRRARRRSEPPAQGKGKEQRRRRLRRPKRRRDVSLPGAIGAEAHLPALPGLRIGSRLMSIALLGGWALVIQSAWMHPTLRIGDLEVQGLESLPVGQIISRADLEGTHVFNLNPDALEAKLEAYPEFETATVKLRWPNQVVIQVTERVPVAEWSDGGRIWWLSASGVAFLQRQDRGGLVRVVSERPVLQIGEDPNAPVIDPEVIREATVLSELFPEITEFTFDTEHGLGFHSAEGWQALFGSGDVRMKARIYQAIVDKVDGNDVPIFLISVENPHTPYYRTKR